MQQDREARNAEETTAEGARAAEQRDDAGTEVHGASEAPAEGVLVLVCFKCGTEYYFEDEAPPPELECGKCGNRVFRSFFTPTDDEANEDFEDSTARDLAPDDAEGDATEGDVMDLNRL